MKIQSGFTLLEMVVTTAIIGIVMAFAVPALDTFIKNDRLTTQINTLVGHLAYARSEAVLRHQPIILCASDSMTTCSASGNWANGWILFVDADNSSSFNAGEDILRVRQALSGSNTLTSSTGGMIIYDQRGFSPNTNGVFSLCDDRGATEMKSLTISKTGRVRQGGGTTC